MKRILLTFSVVTAFAVSGCASLKESVEGVIGITPTQAATISTDGYQVAKAALLVYRDGYQAAVLVYGQQPICGTTTELACRDEKLWTKLKAIDATATPAIDAGAQALKAANGDMSAVPKMMTAISNAENGLTQLGLAPKL